MFRYAQVNMKTGIVESDSCLSSEGMEKKHPNLIPISADFDLTDKKWDFETETWVEYIPEPVEPVEPVPTQLDRIENNLALLTEDTAEYKAFYEAAKEILPEGSDA